MAAFLAFMCQYLPMFAPGGSLIQLIEKAVIELLLTAGICSTANGFLILAITSLTRQRGIVTGTWRIRHLVDFAVALVVWLIPVKR